MLGTTLGARTRKRSENLIKVTWDEYGERASKGRE